MWCCSVLRSCVDCLAFDVLRYRYLCLFSCLFVCLCCVGVVPSCAYVVVCVRMSCLLVCVVCVLSVRCVCSLSVYLLFDVRVFICVCFVCVFVVVF